VNRAKDDVRCMKQTMNADKKIGNEFFDFHDKVGTILDE
jgi:hypothetical protein